MNKTLEVKQPCHVDEKSSQWYIAYTFSRAERAAQQKLEMIGVSSYVPLHKVQKNWSDRKKILETPLFPNYIFIYASQTRKHEILKMKEIVNYITFEGKAVTVSESLINSIKKIVEHDVEVTSLDYSPGMRVLIKEGPLAGVEGKLLKKNDKNFLLVEIKILQRAVAINIPCDTVISV